MQNEENTTVINVPLYIPTVLIEQGAIELYASKRAQWTPKIKQSDVNGNEIEIDNPVSAKDAGIKYIQDLVRNDYRDVSLDMGAQAGREQAAQQFDAIFKK